MRIADSVIEWWALGLGILCFCLVLLPFSALLADQQAWWNKDHQLDRTTEGVVVRKARQGKESFYIAYTYETVELRQIEQVGVMVDEAMFNALSEGSRVQVRYNSTSVSISNIAGNRYIEILNRRLAEIVAMMVGFAIGTLLVLMYIVHHRKK